MDKSEECPFSVFVYARYATPVPSPYAITAWGDYFFRSVDTRVWRYVEVRGREQNQAPRLFLCVFSDFGGSCRLHFCINIRVMENIISDSRKERVKWVDLLKGASILGVIFVHAPGCPEWWTPNHVNAIFFFLSGFFFKPKAFVDFVKRNVYTLLIPFFIFFLLSYPFRICVELWDNRSLDAVTWTMILDVFKVVAKSDYLYVNVPLWFILCLFWVQIFYYFISKLPLWAKTAVLFAIWLFWDLISEVASPFMINNALCWTLYFGIGNLAASTIFRLVKDRRNSLVIIVSGIGLMFAIDCFLESQMATNAFYIVWCFVLVAVASLFEKIPGTKWLEFFGVNTLAILCTHLFILIPIGRVQFKIFQHADGIWAFVMTVITALLLVPAVMFINKY